MRVTKKKLKEEYGAPSNGLQGANNSANVRLSPLSSPVQPLTCAPKTTTPTSTPRKRAAPGSAKTKKTPFATAITAAQGSDDEEVASPTKKQKKSDSVSPTTKVKREAHEIGGEDERDYFT